MAGKFPKGPFSDVPNVEKRIAAIKCPAHETHMIAVKVNRAGWLQATCPYTRCGVDIKTQNMSGAAWLLKKIKPGHWEAGAKNKALSHFEVNESPKGKPVEKGPKAEKPKSFLDALFGDDEEAA